VQRGHRPGLAQAEVPQCGGVGFEALVVDLVGHEHDRLARPPQQPHDTFVGVGGADGRVDDEQDDIGQVDGHLGLLGDAQVDALLTDLPATGVDEGEPPARPLRLVSDPVARHAGHVLDDGLAAAQDAVDQGRLAHVGAAHDGDNRLRALGEPRQTAVSGARQQRTVLVAEVEVLQAGAQDALHARVVRVVGIGGIVDIRGGGVSHGKQPRSVRSQGRWGLNTPKMRSVPHGNPCAALLLCGRESATLPLGGAPHCPSGRSVLPHDGQDGGHRIGQIQL